MLPTLEHDRGVNKTCLNIDNRGLFVVNVQLSLMSSSKKSSVSRLTVESVVRNRLNLTSWFVHSPPGTDIASH